jgi:hypothetical protein
MHLKGSEIKMWWKCPNCQSKVDYSQQMNYVFSDDDNEADFDPESGLWMHTITCNCGAYWTTGISSMAIRNYDKI